MLLVASSYLPNAGGLQTATAGLAGELHRRGYEVTVLAQRYPRSLAASEVLDGVPVRRLLFLTPRLSHLQNGRLDLFLAGLVYFPATLLLLLAHIARQRPDVVNLHFLGAPAIFLLATRALIRFRYVVSLHGDDVEGLPRGTAFDRWVFRATLRRADAVTACSGYLLEQAKAIEPAIAGKDHIAWNGIELDSELPSDVRPGSILCVGRMVPKKGFDVLLRAIARLDGHCHLHATLAGDGPERQSLEALAGCLSLNGKAAFRGALSQREVMAAIRESTLIVIPSRQEPFGIVALEAMAAGKPVVASRVGGLPEVLDGADALLVEPDDPEALASAIGEALARLEREPEFGARNRETAARFSVPRMADGYVAVYGEEAPG